MGELLDPDGILALSELLALTYILVLEKGVFEGPLPVVGPLGSDSGLNLLKKAFIEVLEVSLKISDKNSSEEERLGGLCYILGRQRSQELRERCDAVSESEVLVLDDDRG